LRIKEDRLKPVLFLL